MAALEVSRDNREDLLVELWYGYKDGGEWKSAAFAPAPLAVKDLTVRPSSSSWIHAPLSNQAV